MDLTWIFEFFPGDQDGIQVHAETQSMQMDGVTPRAVERRKMKRFIDEAGEDALTGIPKLRKGDDEEEHRKMARGKCREIFSKLDKKVDEEKRKRGEKTAGKGKKRS